MAWVITRYAGPGEAILGPEMVIFDESGKVFTENPGIAQAAFGDRGYMVQGGPGTSMGLRGLDPETGEVPVPLEPLAVSFPAGHVYTEEDLDAMTPAQLLALAKAHRVPTEPEMSKPTLIAAILASQPPVP